MIDFCFGIIFTPDEYILQFKYFSKKVYTAFSVPFPFLPTKYIFSPSVLIIKPSFFIEDKFKSDEYLPQAAASNAEIFTSLNINPAVKGLSLSGGPYSNSGGGSDIREAFLIDNALAFLSRHEVNAPVEMMARHNFKLDDDIKIKDRSIILTTLDSGCGTKKLS